MCFYYDGTCEVWKESHPKARREHHCIECRGTIAKGEVYHKVNSVFDGSWSTTKECAKCHAVRKQIAEIEQSHGCRGSEAWCPFGELGEAISEAGDHYGLLSRDNINDVDRVVPAVAHLFPDAIVMTQGA